MRWRRAPRFPGALYPTDILVLVFLAAGISAGCAGLGIRDRTVAVIFTMAWVSSAVTRLSALRQGRRPSIRIDRLDVQRAATLMLGAAPWVLLRFLQTSYPVSAFWTPIAMGVPMQVFGTALAICVVAAPLLGRAAISRSASGDLVLRSAAVVLITGSPVFAALSGLWIVATFWPTPEEHVSDWRPTPVQPVQSVAG